MPRLPHRPLLPAGVALGKQGLRLQLTLSVTALLLGQLSGHRGRRVGSAYWPGGGRAGAQLCSSAADDGLVSGPTVW